MSLFPNWSKFSEGKAEVLGKHSTKITELDWGSEMLLWGSDTWGEARGGTKQVQNGEKSFCPLIVQISLRAWHIEMLNKDLQNESGMLEKNTLEKVSSDSILEEDH